MRRNPLQGAEHAVRSSHTQEDSTVKKLVLIAAAVSALSAAALAGPQKGKPAAKAATEIKCPVMPTHSVNIKDATKAGMFADYKGRRYFFCCNYCPGEFKRNPEKYAKGPSIATPRPAATPSKKGK